MELLYVSYGCSNLGARVEMFYKFNCILIMFLKQIHIFINTVKGMIVRK